MIIWIVSALILVALIVAGRWGSIRANDVSPAASAALATLGVVNTEAWKRSLHLRRARHGFYLLRGWHWWRYSRLTAAA